MAKLTQRLSQLSWLNCIHYATLEGHAIRLVKISLNKQSFLDNSCCSSCRCTKFSSTTDDQYKLATGLSVGVLTPRLKQTQRRLLNISFTGQPSSLSRSTQRGLLLSKRRRASLVTIHCCLCLRHFSQGGLVVLSTELSEENGTNISFTEDEILK